MQRPNFTDLLRDIREAEAIEERASGIAQRGSPRWCEVMREELECERDDERRERDEAGE
jgi:hypothetical protein